MKKFGEYDGIRVTFPAGKQPFHTAILFNSICAIAWQSGRGKLRDSVAAQLDAGAFKTTSEFELKSSVDEWAADQYRRVLGS